MNTNPIVLKRVARELSLRRRYSRLTANDVIQSEQLEKVLLCLAFMWRRLQKSSNSNEEKRKKTRKAFNLTYQRYIHLLYEEEVPLEKPRRLNRSIGSFCESDCYIFFRFKQTDLIALVDLLQLNETFMFDNNERMSGEEILLRGLYELCSGETQHKIARNVFGRDMSSQSRAFGFFIDYIFENFSHLLRNNMKWWYDNGYFAASAQAIGVMLDLNNGRDNLVSHFIDCNCFELQRVGGGPAEGGANAARWDPHIQRAFYNGWKSCNGLKHQTVDDAFGFTCDCYGPTSLRRNDLTLLRLSDINDTFTILQLESDIDYIIFGDSAYKRQSHIRSYFSVTEEVPDSALFNRRMKRLRISIEWNYGHQASLFRYLTTSFKLKLLATDRVTRLFIATTLLRNLHTGFYGSQSSQYFKLHVPADFNYNYINQLPCPV